MRKTRFKKQQYIEFRTKLDQFVQNYVKEFGFRPNCKIIAHHFNMNTTSVYGHLKFTSWVSESRRRLIPPKVSKEQKKYLDFFLEYQNEHGFAPTYNLAAKELGVSRQAVFDAILRAERDGLVCWILQVKDGQEPPLTIEG